MTEQLNRRRAGLPLAIIAAGALALVLPTGEVGLAAPPCDLPVTIDIANSGFEDPTRAPNTGTLVMSLPGWTVSGEVRQWGPGSTFPSGSQYVGLGGPASSGSLSQQLDGTVLAGTTVTLQITARGGPGSVTLGNETRSIGSAPVVFTVPDGAPATLPLTLSGSVHFIDQVTGTYVTQCPPTTTTSTTTTTTTSTPTTTTSTTTTSEAPTTTSTTTSSTTTTTSTGPATSAPTTAPPTTPTTTTVAPTPAPTTTAPAGPSAAVARSTIAPAQVQTGTGSGFQPGEAVTGMQRSVDLDLGTQIADADGEVTFSWTIRPDETIGEHSFIVTGANSGTASTTFSVVAGTPALPRTGSDPAAMTIVAVALTLAGAAALTLVSVRRSQR